MPSAALSTIAIADGSYPGVLKYLTRVKSKPVYFIALALSVILLAAGLFFAWFSTRADSPEAMAARVSDRLARELALIDEQLSPMLGKPFSIGTAINTETTYPFLIYDRYRLKYWSDNKFVPPLQVLVDSFDVRLLRIGREAYILKRDRIDSEHVVISLVTLLKDYTISNDYLTTEWNEDVFPSPNFSILDPTATLGAPVCLGDNCVFRIHFSPDQLPVNENLRAIAITFFVLSIAAFLIMVFSILPAIRSRSPEWGFVYLLVVMFLLRALMTGFQFPSSLLDSAYFDPQVFASSAFNASLGDMLINVVAILVLCLYLFRNFFRSRLLLKRHDGIRSWLLLILCGLLVLFAWLYPYIVIQTLYNNSAIVLDISQSLQFGGLRIVALISVLLSGISAFLFAHPFISVLVSQGEKGRFVVAFLAAMILFAGFNELTGQAYLSSLVCGSVNFFAVSFLRLHKNLRVLSYGTFAYLFVCIFFLSANGAWAIRHFTHKEKIEAQFRFANAFLIDRDFFAEYLLNDAAGKIGSDAFIQTRIMSPFLGKEPVRQKIRQLFLPGYFNKYDIQIYIFNSFGAPVDNQAPLSFQDLVRAYAREPYRTDYENIFLVTNPESDVTRKYVMVVPIERLQAVYGYVVIELSLKKIIPENVYPELLVDRTFQQFYHTQDLNYAVFSSDDIVFTSGEYNYEKLFNRAWLKDERLSTSGISINGYDHIAEEDQAGRVAVVSSRSIPTVYGIANFSFLFVLGLFIILVMIFIQGVYNYFLGKRLFFSARIQLYLNLAFFVPLIIVSVTTLGLTSRSSQQQLNNEYLNKSRVFGQQIAGYLNQDVNDIDDGRTSLSNHLADIAQLSNLDANLYNTQGHLIATSQPLIFESNLLSRYINSNAYFRILAGENLVIEAEHVGKLRYYVAYTALKSPQTADLIGILGIPFFQSASLLERVQTTILTNILNIFAVIFIVLLVLSYFVSERLTFPLRFITQSLRKTSLTKTNEPLTWTATDEIGIMVKEYNSMLFKLSESKIELEQTQREKAWREIAQQVAHEIKNPLTPMKLTLQQLERAIREGNGSPERTKKAIESLLSQVDTLNDIASSFSGFAKMPEPVIQKLELVALLKRVTDLHSPTGEIALRSNEKEVYILGDEQLLSRTFSNLILNGLQSGRPGRRTRVTVTLEAGDDKVKIYVEDNGRGIDPEIADRIFLPHFSTKKSGSGLGLAISRQAVHQMNGTISFETKVGKGTKFIIELPRQ